MKNELDELVHLYTERWKENKVSTRAAFIRSIRAMMTVVDDGRLDGPEQQLRFIREAVAPLNVFEPVKVQAVIHDEIFVVMKKTDDCLILLAEGLNPDLYTGYNWKPTKKYRDLFSHVVVGQRLLMSCEMVESAGVNRIRKVQKAEVETSRQRAATQVESRYGKADATVFASLFDD